MAVKDFITMQVEKPLGVSLVIVAEFLKKALPVEDIESLRYPTGMADDLEAMHSRTSFAETK